MNLKKFAFRILLIALVALICIVLPIPQGRKHGLPLWP